MPTVKRVRPKWFTIPFMANYVDGFLIPIPTKNLAAYKKLASKGNKIWTEHGALAYFETAGDELDIKGVKSFAKLTRATKNETVILAWIVYKSKAHRNAVNKKVMADPRIAKFDPAIMPFNSKRMVYGGFKVLVKSR